MTTRQEIEQHIIGAAILENAFGCVAHVLTYKNFTRSELADNALIWTVMESLYPHKPIDLMMLNKELEERYKVNYKYALACYTSSIMSSKHITYWAFVLLEMDIRTKTMFMLNEWSNRLTELHEKTAIQEVVKHINHESSDILKVLPAAIGYLRSCSLDNAAEELQEINSMISEKAYRIKRLDHYERLKAHLQRLEEELEIINPNKEAAA